MKNTEFSIRLKTLMANKSLKIRDVARMMNCSGPTVSSWRGGKLPPPETQKRLADVLGVPTEYLAFGIGEDSVFSNTRERRSETGVRKSIESHISSLLNDAEKIPGCLEHMYIELLLKFPSGVYSSLLRDIESRPADFGCARCESGHDAPEAPTA